MAYGGTLIPGSVAITPHRYASTIQLSDDSPCGPGMKEKEVPLLPKAVLLLRQDIVPSASRRDVGPLSIQHRDTVPSLAYDGLAPQPKPYVDKPQFTRP